jgi:hypothetical protein
MEPRQVPAAPAVKRGYEYLSPAECAVICGKNRETVTLALREGELHDSQRVRAGKWTIRNDCLVAWIEVTPCAHATA